MAAAIQKAAVQLGRSGNGLLGGIRGLYMDARSTLEAQFGGAPPNIVNASIEKNHDDNPCQIDWQA